MIRRAALGPGARAGFVGSVPTVIPVLAIGVSFGVLAEPVLGAWGAVVMSAIVWSGTAQFAAVGVLGAGGTTALAAGTGLLANTRYLPMGFAIAPDTHGNAVRRAWSGALLADASFAIAHRGEGRFDIEALEWASVLQYVSWLAGTVAGVLGARLLADPAVYGLDALFPVFYLGLLLPELRGRGRRPLVVAALAAGITLSLVPFTPAGVPVMAAAAAALVGLRRPA